MPRLDQFVGIEGFRTAGIGRIGALDGLGRSLQGQGTEQGGKEGRGNDLDRERIGYLLA